MKDERRKTKDEDRNLEPDFSEKKYELEPDCSKQNR